jgi:hypothetical protein
MSYILTPSGRKQIVAESVEQVDELSKKTLASYTSKAAYDISKTSAVHARAQDAAAARNDAARKARKKIDYDSPDHKKGREALARLRKRQVGIQTAVKKLSKEDIDMDHFVEYVIENFPELTEKYIQENYEQKD